MLYTWRAGALALLVAALPAPALADPITITGDTANSTSNLGNFTATLVYTPTSATQATLSVMNLDNTSPLANGGFITAFVFNNPNNLISGVNLMVTGNPNFSLLGGPTFNNTINAQPFGDFDIGVTTDPTPNNNSSFEGGGNPNRGIGVNAAPVTFNFLLTGTMLNTLDESSFLNTFSNPRGDDLAQAAFVVRFRGFNDGGSDKAPGIAVGGGGGGGGGNGGVIPEPTSLALWGLGTLGVAAYLRRRRAARA